MSTKHNLNKSIKNYLFFINIIYININRVEGGKTEYRVTKGILIIRDYDSNEKSPTLKIYYSYAK